jgi:PelA/Pel-15E family pectate lyase
LFTQTLFSGNMRTKHFILFFLLMMAVSSSVHSQTNDSVNAQISFAIKKATTYLDGTVGDNGGYVWYYKTDLSRRWGEMEAYSSMAWVQGPGTVEMGNTFLDIYEVTHDEYYINLAKKSARALIKGQLECGGWNYMIDFAGETSIKNWYNTIGKNGWRLEEFQHYYGNATFDDASTPGAATFLLRMYLATNDPDMKVALDKAIQLVLISQYPLGGWPQRFPIKDQFNKNGNPDYTPYYTFNDGVVWNNIKFLLLCYETLHEERFLNPIQRGMNFFLLAQQPNPQAGWSQQYSLDLKPAGARSYEPKSLDPQYTARHIEMLIRFYEMTGDKKYVARIPDALQWIESVKFSELQDGSYRVPKFVELNTNRAIYTHRIGSNVRCGRYFYDYDSTKTLAHYRSFRTIDMKQLKQEVETIPDIAGQQSNQVISIPGVIVTAPPLKNFDMIDNYMEIASEHKTEHKTPALEAIKAILADMDSTGRWLISHAYISNPYIGEPAMCTDSTTTQYAHTHVGDQYDTSPYENPTNEKFISTGTYIKNVHVLLNYIGHVDRKTEDE